MATSGALSAKLLATLERRIVLTPSLRRLIEGLPEGPPAGDQVDSVAALLVLNAWICLSHEALSLLRDLDRATDGVLGLYPRDASLSVATDGDAERARAATMAVTTKLGFSPGHRTKVAQVVHDCARAVARSGGRRLDLLVLLGERRGLLAVAHLGAEASRAGDEARIGSAPWLSPRHIGQIADEYSLRDGPHGAPLLRATFYVGGKGAR